MLDIETLMIDGAPSYKDGSKYLRNKYRDNKKRFISRFIEPIKINLQMHDVENYEDICNFYMNLWDSTKAFTYEEAFSIMDDEFRAKVFSVIDVPQMINNLGTTRIKVSGIDLVNRVYNKFKKEFIEEEFTQIYELHEVNGEKLKLTEKIYAIKCWCTSTKDEHWLWIDSQMAEKNDPLECIASTCKTYKSMLGNIKHIIRQGDVFLFEMIDDTILPKENEEVVPLDATTYFKLLKSQS